jgi:hypothetical protein
MKSFEVPLAPGLVWHSDYLTWRKQEYVFFVDGFSGWVELYAAPSRTPAALTKITRLQMMRQGVPRKIQADQGSTYSSHEYAEFCKKWGIQLRLSSPKHEQGNAVAEANVKKIKHLFDGAASEDELVAAFLAMNQTPGDGGRPSPAEIHLGRNIRDELHGKVCPRLVEWNEVREWKLGKQAASKTLYDRKTRDLAELEAGQKVRVWHNEKWRKGMISEKSTERPRSYKVQLENGGQIERNRVKIRSSDPNERPENERKVSPMPIFFAGAAVVRASTPVKMENSQDCRPPTAPGQRDEHGDAHRSRPWTVPGHREYESFQRVDCARGYWEYQLNDDDERTSRHASGEGGERSGPGGPDSLSYLSKAPEEEAGEE